MFGTDRKTRTYRATELKQSIGEVLIAAGQAPVYISKHQIPRYVLMTIDTYQAINAELGASRKSDDNNSGRVEQSLPEALKSEKLEQA